MYAIQFKKTILATAVAILVSPINSPAEAKMSKHFGKNAPFSIEQLPSGRVKDKLKSLKGDKQRKAMKWLHSFEFTKHDLKHMQIDNNGDVLYGDSFDLTELADTPSETVEQPLAISAEDTFKLHSKPGASNVIYIDVNGHTITGTAWNSSSSSIQARPFDTDGNSSSFSSSELTSIAEIWHRIAEDYAPFDTDVTTEEPASFGPKTGRILITYNQDASGNDMPYATSGGVAYVNVWGRSNYASYYSPALVYYNRLASFPTYIAEAASHEMGHNLGLSHDGTSTSSYYTGHGSGFVSWAPIMGVGYNQNVTQWSKGEYSNASLTQDDISIISSKLTARADDHGNDIFTPSTLLVDAQGVISATSPEADPQNLSPENKGIIESRTDVDFFAFDAGAGAIDLTVTPAWDSFYRSSRRGANLDIKISLYNWDGQLLASNDPSNDTDAQITTTVPSGQYLLAVTGVGNSISPYSDYGSLGQYFISGNVQPFSVVTDNTPPSPNPMAWTVAPYVQTATAISMQANTATDNSGSVQYKFICVSGATGCTDSTWQNSTQYIATGLQAGASYSFQVIAKDAFGNKTNPSTIGSAILPINHAPQTSNSSVTTNEDSSISINLASQSSDPDGDPLSYSIQTQASHGNLVNLGNGSFNYIPANNYNGADSFNYIVSDGLGGTATGLVSINVLAVNDAPIASIVAPTSNSSLTVNFSSAGSHDPDAGDSISYQWTFGDGSSSNTANPSHSYANAGTYTVALTVTDNHGATHVKSISTTVTDPANQPPETPSNLNATVDKVVTGRGRRRVVTGTVALNWNTTNFATAYEIWRCDVITSGKRKNRVTTCNYNFYADSDNTSYVATLENGEVRYKVRATNTVGTSNFSNEISIKP